jgi:hypothetical protein
METARDRFLAGLMAEAGTLTFRCPHCATADPASGELPESAAALLDPASIAGPSYSEAESCDRGGCVGFGKR